MSKISTMIGGTLEINNLPDMTDKSGFMVVTNDRGDLWYYGLYETEERARQAVSEHDNKFVVKV